MDLFEPSFDKFDFLMMTCVNDTMEMINTAASAIASVENRAPQYSSVQIGTSMGKTKERAWRNKITPVKKPKMTQKIDKNRGNTKERDWSNRFSPIKKVKQTQQVCDVELLDLKQEECELVENVSPMLASLEKFSSPHSGMICVHGYKVKQSNAPILEAIFKKHGDIAAECVFKTNSMRSSILEVVCEVVRRIQTNELVGKMDEIERQMSDAKAANIDVSWLQAHLEAIHISNKYNLLMEMKSNTILVNRAAQMDLRERCAELVAAQQQFEKAERCVRVLHLVEKNLNDNILESKDIIDSWEQSKRSVAATKVRQSGKDVHWIRLNWLVMNFTSSTIKAKASTSVNAFTVRVDGGRLPRYHAEGEELVEESKDDKKGSQDMGGSSSTLIARQKQPRKNARIDRGCGTH
ncbi:hypothetical protein E3N88_10044 [Mikania micrantha]|uniref:Phospholipase-like protein n=1 Tax=Mikania micrantha TaxID=192012 RepID=A0A5N6P9Q5_9ASTR|nr:hypothetical protein E3N88_10044 [Mikania micrantha]